MQDFTNVPICITYANSISQWCEYVADIFRWVVWVVFKTITFINPGILYILFNPPSPPQFMFFFSSITYFELAPLFFLLCLIILICWGETIKIKK